MLDLNQKIIPVPALRSHIIPPGGLRPLIRSWSRDTAFSFGPLQNVSPPLRLSAVSAVTMLKSTSSRARSTSSNSSLEEMISCFGCLTKGVENERTSTIALNLRVWTSTMRPELLELQFKSWRRQDLKKEKNAKITNPLRGMDRVSEVEAIHDGPLLLNLKIVVVEKAKDLLLDLHAIRIE
jgi:hypothetical protein